MFLTVLQVGLGHWTPPQMFVTALLVGLGWECLKVICIFSAHSTVLFSPVLQTLACPCSIYICHNLVWYILHKTHTSSSSHSTINAKFFTHASCHVIYLNVIPSFVYLIVCTHQIFFCHIIKKISDEKASSYK